jgi:hypothetical protein
MENYKYAGFDIVIDGQYLDIKKDGLLLGTSNGGSYALEYAKYQICEILECENLQDILRLIPCDDDGMNLELGENFVNYYIQYMLMNPHYEPLKMVGVVSKQKFCIFEIIIKVSNDSYSIEIVNDDKIYLSLNNLSQKFAEITISARQTIDDFVSATTSDADGIMSKNTENGVYDRDKALIGFNQFFETNFINNLIIN